MTFPWNKEFWNSAPKAGLSEIILLNEANLELFIENRQNDSIQSDLELNTNTKLFFPIGKFFPSIFNS